MKRRRAMVQRMKSILPAVLCGAFLTACDKPEEPVKAAAPAPPKPEQRLKPVSAGTPTPQDKPAAGSPTAPPEIVVETPASPDDIAAYYAKLQALEAKAQPILDAAAASNPDAVSEADIKSARDALQALMKQRGKLTPGLNLEQRKELAKRSAPLVPKLTAAITKLQISRTTRNARQNLSPAEALPAAPGVEAPDTPPAPAAQPEVPPPAPAGQ